MIYHYFDKKINHEKVLAILCADSCNNKQLWK